MSLTNPEQRILDSWSTNARSWIRAVRNKEIESRRLVTDQAVVDVVLSRDPRQVIDLGCGEGWLTRTLGQLGVETLGIDGASELIEVARKSGEGEYLVHSYQQLADEQIGLSADCVVCNFSLIGKESVDAALRAAARLLRDGGSLVVQTLHPIEATGEEPYVDGWRKGSWAGFADDFTDPAPWYFRTMESWMHSFEHHGFAVVEVIEPLHPESGSRLSVIFVAEPSQVDPPES
jgi:2-polyprenyl-3-methyl-5-hydroxy-6-metoxy-1,4-benzoquinol methylase